MLRWKGEALVYDGPTVLRLGVETQVSPFARARSKTWLMDEGPENARTMVIEPYTGWVERDGRQEPLPKALVDHERAQFSVYGLMLLAPLLPEETRELPDEAGFHRLFATRPPAPPTELRFDAEYRLAEALNRVPAPDGEGTVAQRFTFSAERMPGAVRWPRALRIEQAGKPYFELRLSHFRTDPR